MSYVTFAQGKMMLVGGGAESQGAWSDLPYQWAVENSFNKKVAIISDAVADNFIPDYFISLGATAAVNFKIDSRSAADLQSTYDALMQYDVFFFKGGDQLTYYEYFKNTKTSQAIIDKFNAGGVISGTSAGMAILSGVMFTAENGSVYPDEALQDFNNDKVTLVDDFLPLFPGFIFDTHFTERGRQARLLAFMANWYVNTGSVVTGVGVDDRTALCIDANKLAMAYGTGTVSIYNSVSFQTSLNKPIADSVHAIQLLHGHVIDWQQMKITIGADDFLVPNPSAETGNYQVIVSGSEGLSSNTDFLNYLINDVGETTDTVIIVTALGKGKSYTQKLRDIQVGYVVVETNSAFNDSLKIDLRNQIRRAKKILFVENDDTALFNFLANGPTGVLISNHIKRNNILSAFIGEDSRYAGKVYVTNHLDDAFAAYYGNLQYKKGLGLLRSSVIMSNTYDENDVDYYENTTAAIPYAMIADSTKYGIYLNKNSYVRFYQEGGQNHFASKGNASAMIVINNGSYTDFAKQAVNGAGDTRNYVGFSNFQYVLLNGEHFINVGTTSAYEDLPYEFETHVVGLENNSLPSSIHVFPNPSYNGHFFLDIDQPNTFTITVTNLMRNTLWKKTYKPNDDYVIDLSCYPNGMYIITLTNSSKSISTKIIKYGGMCK